VSLPRSYLYVPGDRSDRLEKAHGRGADALIADLEDAVAPGAKDAARDNIADWLDSRPASGHGPQIWVRVNSGDRQDDDLSAVATHPRVTGVFLPKVDAAEDVARADAFVTGLGGSARWAPMIESARGLVQAQAIAAAANVHQLHLGEMDLATDLGLTPTDGEEEMLHARSVLVIASRTAGLLPPAAPVSAEIDDTARYEETTRLLRSLGFFGRDCIHPAQLTVANRVFTPSEADVAWARDVLDAARTGPGAFRDREGAMVDEAILRRARRILGE
jgi:citrate lyase subunit beta / citryl-CoA lyase